MTAWALTAYSIGLAGYAAIKVLSPSFYALDDARTPMYVSIGSVAVHAPMSFGMMHLLSQVGVSPDRPDGYGHVGVALATSTVALVNFAALTFFMRRRIKRLNGRDIFLSFVKVAIASATMSVVAYAIYYFLHQRFHGASFVYNAIEALVPIAVGGLIFFAAAKVLRVSEVDKVYRIFARKLGRG
jgi:putative peptidoglycan lipid II flippase